MVRSQALDACVNSRVAQNQHTNWWQTLRAFTFVAFAPPTLTHTTGLSASIGLGGGSLS